jgi:ketosteroid isomerase-like protein
MHPRSCTIVTEDYDHWSGHLSVAVLSVAAISEVNMRCAKLLVTILVAATLGCAPGSNPSTDEAAAEAAARAALEQAQELYRTAALSGDVDLLLSLYMADAVFMAPNMEPLRGQPAIRDFAEAMFADGGFAAFTYDSHDLQIRGDVAVDVSTYSLTTAGAQSSSDRGSDIHIWRRQPDSSWKIQYDLFNSSRPLAQQ